MTNEIDWDNAPHDAEWFANNSFRKSGHFYFADQWNDSPQTKEQCFLKYRDYQERPQRTVKQHQNEQDELKPQNPYQRTIIGLDGSKCVVDVYRVLDAFKTDSPALDHAIKKILCPGTRHAKTREQDLKEAINSIEAELLLMEQRK